MQGKTYKAQPFITIFTRCCRRPQALECNIQSVMAQSVPHWEQLLVVDHTGKHDIDPILWANTQFERYADHIRGEYVYMLDDDGFLVANTFVESAMRVAQENNSDIIMVKMRTFNLDNQWRIHPEPPIWDLAWENGARPKRYTGTGYDFVVRTDVWRKHIHHYQHAPGGDWHFINALLQNTYSVNRLDLLVAGSRGRGCGVLFEKCGADWFDEILCNYQPELVTPNVWRLSDG